MPALPNLATQLNDLAVANQDGLLNDEEYRLLKTESLRAILWGSRDPLSPPRRKHVELVEPPPPRPQTTPTRTKSSAVAGFLRRATGRRSASPSPPVGVIKLSLPRMFSKKPEPNPPSDTDSSVTRSSSSPSFSRKGSSADLHPRPTGLVPTSPTRPRAEPTSPNRSNFDAPLVSPSRSAFAKSKYDVIPGGSNDIFDDDNLHTSEDIRNAIAAVEAEARRLVTAFNDLETSAVIRYRQEHPQRQRSGSNSGCQRPSPTPHPSPSSSSQTAGKSRSASTPHNADAQSVRSSSSLRTSKSTSAFSQSTPPPPTSAWSRLPSLRRKGSTSSISSQGASSFLGVRAASGLSRSSTSVSRSTSHLPLPVPAHASGSGSVSTMMELLNHTPVGEGGEELTEVRRRRAEMMGRCEARLEYLRARLKGAQIHEKLLKK